MLQDQLNKQQIRTKNDHRIKAFASVNEQCDEYKYNSMNSTNLETGF